MQGKQSRRDKSGWVAVQRSVASLRKAEKVERLIFHYALFPSLVGRDLSGSVGGTHSAGCHSGRILKFFLIVFNLYLIFFFFFLSLFLSLCWKSDYRRQSCLDRGTRESPESFSGDEKLASRPA